VEARPSRSRADRGLVRTKGELINQDERIVLDLMAMNLLGRREPGNQS
jgi:acyl dehydratase